MKKVILIVTFILAAIIGSFGIIKINEKGNSVSQHYDMNISDDILCDGDEVFEAVKSNAPALSYDGDSVKLGYMSDDLVYREYSWGHCLEKGYEIIIEKCRHYPTETLSLSNYVAYFLLLFYIPSQRTDCHDPSE